MFPLAAIGVLLLPTSLPAQAKRFPLDSTVGLRLHNVVAEPAVLQGKKGLRIVHDQEQPTLIVNDLKTGAEGKGAVALWSHPSTVAHFRNLRIETSSKESSK